MKVRLKQVSLGSQLKIILFAGLAAGLLFSIGLLLLDLLLGGVIGRGDPPPVTIMAAIIIVGGFTLLHALGLLLLRLLPWRGPEIAVQDAGTVSSIFE